MDMLHITNSKGERERLGSQQRNRHRRTQSEANVQEYYITRIWSIQEDVAMLTVCRDTGYTEGQWTIQEEETNPTVVEDFNFSLSNRLSRQKADKEGLGKRLRG